MGLMDAIKEEDRIQVKFNTMFQLMKTAARSELLMNAVNCDVPHAFIREMATGVKEEVPLLYFGELGGCEDCDGCIGDDDCPEVEDEVQE